MSARVPVLAVALALASFALPLAARAQSAPARHAAPAAAPAASAEGVVNVNAASPEELERLPGVGPARAAAIVALRQRVQRFHAPEDLMRVRGIGRAGMHRMRPYVVLTGETTLAARPGHAPAHASGPAIAARP